MNVGLLEEPGLQDNGWLSRNVGMYRAHLSEDLVPVFETLEGDEDRPGAPHLRAGVHAAGLGDRHLPLDAHMRLDQRRDLTVQSGQGRGLNFR